MKDFFDVKDDPVLGFSPPAVVTVFHTHVWEGTIDYRFVVEVFPGLTLSYRVCLVVTRGAFHSTTNSETFGSRTDGAQVS